MMLFVAALALVSCVDDVVDTPSTEAKAGDEVQFSLTLPSSRTVYGGETTVGGKNVFPIYWVDGDKVTIFSPQCLDGRRSAEYKVILPDNGDKAYYAKDLQKTGDYGVQWGNNATANFYSLYPSGAYTLSSDGKNAEGVTINYNQNITVNSDGSVTSDMEDCLLYANKTGVASGETVNLHYDPISTVIYVTLKVAANETGTDPDTFTIQSVSLTADKEIAGTFNLDIANGTFAGFATGKSSKTVMAQITNPSTGGYHTISNDESFSIPLFIVPQTDLNVKNWKIQVVANNNEYTKTLNIDKVLTPGQIHKITLPELKPATTEWVVSKWMTYIPRNVYLSEVSIPGSWNSLNPDFQGDITDITSQYNDGVRAFHLDTRWSTTASRSWLLATNQYDVDDLNANNMYLSVADGNDSDKVATGRISGYKGRIMTRNNTSFENYMKSIVSKVKDDEYMVLFCSFAQDSYNDTTKTGMTWMQAISNACDNLNNSDDQTIAGKIFNAQGLDANTLVGDVLGKVIVIVNCETAVSSETIPTNSLCLFVNIPNTLTSDYFPASGFKSDNLYSSSSSLNTKNITIAVSQAQITSSTDEAFENGARGYYPSFAQRTAVVNAILDWSKDNYGTTNYTHNKWIFLGLGGNTAANESSTGDNAGAVTVADKYSVLMDNRLAAMGKNGVPFYPVGIVFMNYAATGSHETAATTETIKAILMLNNKYRLQYDASKPTNYNPNAKAKSAYDSTLNTGGNAY